VFAFGASIDIEAHDGWPGLRPSDEVLTTALTCTATNWPILANGLRIKWVDVDPNTANINLDDLEQKLSPTTKVIICSLGRLPGGP
jgi:dTDP-4-amino-4,6-dideoxygalactose transaminase